MARKCCYLFIIIVFLFGCAASPEKKRSEAEYPSSTFLTAKGTGQSESEARNQAVAEMSRIFRSRVQSDTMDRVKAVVDKTGSEISEQSIESNIRVVSDMELKGVRVEDAWYDRKTAMFSAIAKLDRFQARDNWLNEMRDIDSSIEGELSVLDDADSTFAQFLSLQKILRLWVEREARVSYVRVLGFDARGTTSYDISSVFHLLPKIRAEMVFFIDIHGDHANVIEDVLLESLGNAGLITGDTQEEADVMIRGTVDVSHVDIDNPGWEFARARVSLLVIDAKTGLKVREVTSSKRAGHISYDEAVHKALKKVSVPVSEKITSLF